MKLLKTMFLSVAMLAFANAATAATYDLGQDPYAPDANGSFNSEFTVASAGAFTDIFNFVMGYGQGIDFSALGADTGSGVDFTTIALFLGSDATGTLIATGDVVNNASASLAFVGDQLISGESYSVELVGSAAADNSTYTFSASPVSAVPAPAAIALMLGGLGMVGFMARRRNSSNV